MATRARVCAWIVGCGLAVPSMALAQDRTEHDIVDLIVRDGPRARALRAESDVVRQGQAARQTYPNPTVMYSREGAGFTEFLQVEQTIPLFGVRDALARAGVAAAAAAEAERDARLWALRTDATEAVARLSGSEARTTEARAYVREVERLVEILRTREREGEGSRFDRLRAEQEWKDARQRASAASVEAAGARAAVHAMLPPDAAVGRVVPAAEPRPTSAPPVDQLVARALSARAELRALQRAAEHAGLESAAARSARRPSPSVFGGLKRADVDAGRARGGTFGVNVSVPLFDTGGREAERWTAERAYREAERSAIEQQVRAEVVRAFEALNLRTVAVAEVGNDAGDELVRIAEVAYREGEVGILELLDAARTASHARARSLDLQLEARLAVVALERALGEVLWP